MHIRRTQISFLIFFISTLCSFAVQLKKEDIPFDEILDRISTQAVDETDIDATSLYDDLLYFFENPIDLNHASKEDLEKMLFLSDNQIENILLFAYQYGEIYTLYELKLIDDMDEETIRLIEPFVSVGGTEKTVEPFNVKDIFKHGKHVISQRIDRTLEKKDGYAPNSNIFDANPEKYFVGDPFFCSTKYAFNYKRRVEFGLQLEKDAGEQFWGKYNKGFDSYGGYMQINDLWKFKTIVAGDYRAVFGQGLVMRSELQMGNVSVLDCRVRNGGFRKNNSTDEYNFLRGLAATIALKNIDMSAFYSFRKMDADTTNGSFANLKTDGLHQRINDLSKKRTLDTHVLGCNIGYNNVKYHVGTTVAAVFFGLPRMQGQEAYSRFYAKGKTQFSFGIDYRFRWKRLHFFGETAFCNNIGIATINGISANPVSALGFLFMHRYYSPKYDFLYAGGVGNHSSNNENGFYLGIEIQPFKKWKFSLSVDAYQYPWVSYSTSKSAFNYKLMLRADYNPLPRTLVYVQIRYQDNERNLSNNDAITANVGTKSLLRMLARIQFGIGGVEFRTTIVVNRYTAQSAATFGFAMAQDVGCEIPIIKLKLRMRYLYFDAVDYDNRIAIYENDIPTAFSIPSLYGQGCRYYINLGYNVLKNFSVWFKFAQTYYTDGRVEIGSGINKINGNHKSDLRLLLKFKF